jgi:hydroxyethylthiazole kinase-like uncharacterized protein yjeF
MREAYDADAVRAAEQPLLDGLPPGTLMQRAAGGLARRCAQLLGQVYGSRVVLLVGAGNNGADALWVGVRLLRRGARVDAIVAGKPEQGAAAGFLAGGGRTHLADDLDDDSVGQLLAGADLVVDGMLGIGASGPLREPQARLARLSNERARFVVAVDVPSGVDASTGSVGGEAVRADVTVTFGAWKIGLLVAPGASHAGAVELVDIGLTMPAASVLAPEAHDVATLLRGPGAESDKYRRGVVGVLAGSDRYTGAAVLAVGGALAAGAGMVRYVGPQHAADMVRAHWPEAVVTVAAGDEPIEAAGRVQAWVCGPGLGTDDRAAAVVRQVCATETPILLDADAITLAADQPDLVRRRAGATLLTPHAGEFARLVGGDRDEVERERLSHVRSAAADLRATVLLKGSTTLVAAPDGTVRVNTAQTPYLATAGSGDVLSGVAGALLASGLDPADAGAAAAFVHGLAGLLAAGDPPAPIHASDIAAAVPQAIRTLRG